MQMYTPVQAQNLVKFRADWLWRWQIVTHITFTYLVFAWVVPENGNAQNIMYVIEVRHSSTKGKIMRRKFISYAIAPLVCAAIACATPAVAFAADEATGNGTAATPPASQPANTADAETPDAKPATVDIKVVEPKWGEKPQFPDQKVSGFAVAGSMWMFKAEDNSLKMASDIPGLADNYESLTSFDKAGTYVYAVMLYPTLGHLSPEEAQKAYEAVKKDLTVTFNGQPASEVEPLDDALAFLVQKSYELAAPTATPEESGTGSAETTKPETDPAATAAPADTTAGTVKPAGEKQPVNQGKEIAKELMKAQAPNVKLAGSGQKSGNEKLPDTGAANIGWIVGSCVMLTAAGAGAVQLSRRRHA